MKRQFFRTFSLGAFKHILCVIGIALVAQTSHAHVIFQSTFNQTNYSNLNPLWTEVERNNNDVAVYQSQLRLRGQSILAQDAAVSLGVSLSHYTQLSLQFDWRALASTEPSDTLYVGWKTEANTWLSVWQTALGGSSLDRVELTALEQPGISAQLAFWIDVSAASETVYLDNIIVSGALRAKHSTTSKLREPNTASLLGVFVVLLMVWRRTAAATG